MVHDFERWAALVAAADLGALEAAYRSHPSGLSARGPNGETLLAVACMAVTTDVALPPRDGGPAAHQVVDWLLEAGADPSVADARGWAPLHCAAMAGNRALARRLSAAGAPKEGRLLGASGGSPLALALFYAQTEVADLLAQPAVPDNLRHAAALGRSLERFVVGDGLTDAARTGLDFYRPSAAFPVWERSLERQEVLDEALSWAARNGHVQTLVSLVDLGADLNANAYRGTALLWAIYGDRVDAARWLLAHGADPDLRHDFGGAEHGKQAVAMHLAARYGSMRCLPLLLERGADRTIRDGAYGGPPLDWAEHGGSAEAAALLR